MNVSAWSIRNPIPAILLFVLLTVCGLLGFRAMKIQNLPDVDLAEIVVSVALPGAAPAQIETEVVRKIETAVAGIDGVKHIYSSVQDGGASIVIEFRLEKAPQEALDEVRDAVGRVRSELPNEMHDPEITKASVSGGPILFYTVASTGMSEEALSWFVDHDISKALLSVRGVGGFSRVGGVARVVKIEIQADRLEALGVTGAEVSRQLRRIHQDASGGRTDIGGAEQSVRTIATVSSARELAQMDIPLADGRHIRLGEVAVVADTIAERRAAAYLDGKPVAGFQISRSRGASEVDVMKGVRAELKKIRLQHPDISITEAFNFVDPVIENYEGSMALLYEGAILAVLVVWLFLRDWRATLISAATLPLSVIPTFALMQWNGFTINIVTLLSLSLVVGILVDDAIVEIENIIRHLRMGKTPYQAAMEAADEIGLAVIATTFALIAVFLPTAFMSGVIGKFFVQFGWTVAISVFFSLLVARMLTPLLCAYLLHASGEKHAPRRWENACERLSAWCLKHRLVTLAASMLFLALALGGLAPLLPTGFMPPDDMSQTQVVIELPPGSTFQQTNTLAKQAEEILRRNAHVKMIFTNVGGGASDPLQQNAGVAQKASLTLKLTPRSERNGIRRQAIEGELREALGVLAGARVSVGLGDSSEKYRLALSGADSRILLEHARRVERDLRAIPGIGNVRSDASLQKPELLIRPDFAKAADLGVTSDDIADTLRVATSGDYGQALAKLNLAQRQIPMLLRLSDVVRRDIKQLAHLKVPGTHGPVMLTNIAKLEIASGPAQINRYDRQRSITIDAELNQRTLGEIDAAASKLPSLLHMPPGVSKTAVGDAEAMTGLFEGFGTAMLTGVLCIYLVLVLLFKDFVQPVTILAALVLSVPGAIVALYITRSELSMPAMIGLIMLMGVAAKNSILLVEYTITARRQHGMARIDALLDACRKRARPIVMTTVAMGAGMFPIALGLGTDPSFRAPMAIVIIGGLITSTFLSLLVIPVVFSYLDDLRESLCRCFATTSSTKEQA